MDQQERFKVVIAGGGPVALFLAHCFLKADIDFVILERSDEICKDTGAGVGVGPGPLRVIKQLGFYESFNRMGCEVSSRTWFTPEGKAFGYQEDNFKYVKQNHGHGPNVCGRVDILKQFFGALPKEAKAKVLLNKKVTDVECDERGVTVICADGSKHFGHLVLGADGTHSVVRRAMRRRALKKDPKADWDPESPFLSTYRCMWGSHEQKCPPDYASETCSKDRSCMHYSGLNNRGWIFLYEKLEEPTRGRVAFSHEDALAFKDRFADWTIHPDYKVGDISPDDMFSYGASLLEEGLCKNWYCDRMALVGDAAHKVCPQAGMGLNDGIQDAVLLANHLNKLLAGRKQRGEHGHPSVAQLGGALKAYQDERVKEMDFSMQTSAAYARWQAFANPFFYFMGRYVVCNPFVTYVLQSLVASKTFSRFITLNYVQAEEPFRGAVPWMYPTDGKKRPDV